ncbi:hypothetical protein Pvag_pPag20052 (plasmid) [Pantoea vagans C9-1]|nr:hypothetical protein Pvag_pPag20052 [Pantoea vagans C9-1]
MTCRSPPGLVISLYFNRQVREAVQVTPGWRQSTVCITCQLESKDILFFGKWWFFVDFLGAPLLHGM